MKTNILSGFLPVTMLVVMYTMSIRAQSTTCICTQQFAPVCGTNGITYPNACYLNCDRRSNPGLQVAYTGTCRSCVCTREYNPVCGTDGQTYGNPCTFRCLAGPGVLVAYPGECLLLNRIRST